MALLVYPAFAWQAMRGTSSPGRTLCRYALFVVQA